MASWAHRDSSDFPVGVKPAIVAMPAQDLLAGFAARVLESPDKVALVAGEVSLSYADLDSQSSDLAAQIRSALPVDHRSGGSHA